MFDSSMFIIREFIETNIDLVYKVILSTIIFILVYISKKIIISLIYRNKKDDLQKKYLSKSKILYLLNSLLIIIIFLVWADFFDKFLTFLGLFSAGLAIAMKEPFVNIAGGLYVLWTNPFRVGDRIEMNGHIGDVIDIKLSYFSILEVGNKIKGEQSTGKIIHIPNMLLFSSPLTNYEKGFKYVWNEVQIRLSLESDWKLAKKILLEITEEYSNTDEVKNQLREAGKKYMIYYSNLTPIVYTNVKDGMIILTLRYLCEPRRTRITEQLIWEDILLETEDNKINLI